MLEALHAAEAITAAKAAAVAAEAATQAQIASEQPTAILATAGGNSSTTTSRSFSNNYDFGSCAYYVASRVRVPDSMGNATNWEAGLLLAGWHYGLQAGSIGVSHIGLLGHVVYVESVTNGVPTISEMNAGAGFDRVDTRVAGANEFIWLAP